MRAQIVKNIGSLKAEYSQECFVKVCGQLETRGTFFQLHVPSIPPWTREQVFRFSPFQSVGLEYMGPIYVKHESELKKKIRYLVA